MSTGLINHAPVYMSHLKNDTNFTYAKKFHFTAEDLVESASLECLLGDDRATIYKILISSNSMNSTEGILGFHISTNNETIVTDYDDIYVDLASSIGVIEQDIEFNETTTLLLTPVNLNDIDYQTQIVTPAVEFDVVIFCKPNS